MPDTQDKPVILYAQDALCGWCYGFAPVIDRVRTELNDSISLRPIHGGLWPGAGARKMDHFLISHLLVGMPQVTAATGQIFGQAFIEKIVQNSEFIYDTEPAARAAIVVRDINPAREYDFIKDIQINFFQLGHDPTVPSTFTRITEGYGINSAEFMEKYHSREIIDKTWQEFKTCKNWGVTVFPTFLYSNNKHIKILMSGSRPFEYIAHLVDSILTNSDLTHPTHFG